MKHVKLYEQFVSEAKNEVTVSLRYALMAGEIFRDQFSRDGKQTSTDVYKFKSKDAKEDFTRQLIQAGVPENEIYEAELKRWGNELWNRGGLDERKQMLWKCFGQDFQTEDLTKLPWSELPKEIRLKLVEIRG